jgi:hypothetical protein
MLPVMIGLSADVLSTAFHDWGLFISRIICLSAMSGWLLASLMVVRLAGYRLTWRWRLGRPAETARAVPS